jgi:hypothetical protein
MKFLSSHPSREQDDVTLMLNQQLFLAFALRMQMEVSIARRKRGKSLLRSCFGCFPLNCEIIISFCVLTRYLWNFSSKFSLPLVFPTPKSSLYCKLFLTSRENFKVVVPLRRFCSLDYTFSVREKFFPPHHTIRVKCKTPTRRVQNNSKGEKKFIKTLFNIISRFYSALVLSA